MVDHNATSNEKGEIMEGIANIFGECGDKFRGAVPLAVDGIAYDERCGNEKEFFPAIEESHSHNGLWHFV